MVEPLVSIIIPTYNRAHLIPETLASVLAQTYTHWECIVVDDGSTDNTSEILQNYIKADSRFQYYKRPDNYLSGGNGARNYGFEVSKGKYIQWFDSDDLMMPEYINTKVFAFTKDLDVIVCSGSIINNKLEVSGVLSLDSSISLYKGLVLWRNQITTNCVLFRRRFLEEKKLFNPEILRGQETEFFSRLFFKLPADDYAILNEPLFLYRQHETTKTKINQGYIPKFKYSQSYIYLKNLIRSIEIKDDDLINHCFHTLLVYFFSSIKHKDSKTTGYIYEELAIILRAHYFLVFLEFKMIGGLFILLKRSSYRVEKYWKNKRL